METMAIHLLSNAMGTAMAAMDTTRVGAYHIELEQEDDGRWIAEVMELPGVMVYGDSPDNAIARVKALALRVLADKIERQEVSPLQLQFSVA
jgi:predicted RNase H-like HicB family nuclease